MQRRLVRVVDVFRQFDDDDSGRIDAAEFIKAMREMGLRGDAATDENVGAVFASFDPDASGTIEYAELHELLVRSAYSNSFLHVSSGPCLPATLSR